MNRHVVLLGDSIFDNGAYTGGQPDVVTHLRALLGPASHATLRAVDGSTTAALPAQIARVPADASHLVVAVGGNDALGQADVLDRPAGSVAEGLLLIASRAGRFEADYRDAVGPVMAKGLPTILCTIYNGNFDAQHAAVVRAGLLAFNDAIFRVAFEKRLTVIDLRLVCSRTEDYANAIEPSGAGGFKIASAIQHAIDIAADHSQAAHVVTTRA